MNQTKPVPLSLYAAMALQFAIGGAIIPFVSLYFRDRSLDVHQSSYIFFASSSTLLFFPFLWGMLADRFVPLNRMFVLLNLLATVWLGLLASQDKFLGLLGAYTLFYACFHPTMTLINALSFHHLSNPKEQFASLRAWGSIGWILPSLPIYLWLAFKNSAELGIVLALGISLSLIMAVCSLFLPHTPPGSHKAKEGENRLGYWPSVKILVQNGNYVVLVLCFFFVTASYSILMYYSPPFLEDHGIKRAWIGPIQCMGVVLEIILFRYLPGFLSRWNYSTSLALGCSCLLLRQLLFAFCESPWILAASSILAGAVIVFFHIAASILVNALARSEVRATSQTLLVFFGSGMGPMFANWVTGKLAASSGNNLQPVFLFASALAGVATLLVLLRGKKLNHVPQPAS